MNRQMIFSLASSIYRNSGGRNYWACYREARERLGRSESSAAYYA